jgi:hypothetical protein
MTDHLRPALTRRASSAQQPLGPLLTALLKKQQQDFRAQSKKAAANILAHVMAEAVTSLVSELDRGRPDYIRPTLAAVPWLYPPLRQHLQKQPRYAQALQASRRIARNEATVRAVGAVEVVCWLAEAATHPDERIIRKIGHHWREFERQRGAYQLLCENGHADEAQPNLTEAVKHLVIWDNLMRDLAPDRDKLLRGTCFRLARLFGYPCYGTVARLVSSALACKISRSQAQYAFKKMLQAQQTVEKIKR